MIVFLLSAIVVLLLGIFLVLFCFLLDIMRILREILRFYEETPTSFEEHGMNLTLLKPKPRGHKTRKPTDRSREWMDNRARESREVK